MRRVLFLCSGNYYRSRFAEELFNHLAEAEGLAWRADSCGLKVDDGSGMNVGPLSRWAREGLESRGIVATGGERMPRQVSEAELASAEVIVAVKELEHRPLMRKRHPGWEERVRYWVVHDLDCAQPTEALAELERRVRELVAELREKDDG
jgi:protein-tyrosine phosphatase